MRNIKTIFILVLSLILFAVSCSNEGTTGGETGINNNPPENDTEITDGETGGTGSETETIETIDAKDFPENLKGTYRDEKVASAGFSGVNFDTKVSYDETTKKTKIEGTWLLIKDDGTKSGQTHMPSIEKWKKTTKGGKTIKLEGESSISGGGKYTVIYDYASGTLSGTYTHPDGTWSFNGKKQP